MALFSRFHRKQPEISDAEVSQIRERVRNMREEVGRRDVELADLFALLQEDERPVLREIQEVKRPELERFWPDQIPSIKPQSTSMEPQPAAYANLKPFETSDLPTTP